MDGTDNVVTLGMDFFKSLNSNDKGYFGERIVSFYLRDLLFKSPEKVFSEFSNIESSDIHRPSPQQFHYTFVERGDDIIELSCRGDWDIEQYLIHEDGSREPIGILEEWPENKKPWSPDITLKMSNLYDTDDLKKKILCEVKTGPYAEFRGDQRDVMEILNRSSDRLLLRARVIFDTEKGVIKIRFSKLESTDLDDEVQWTTWKF